MVWPLKKGRVREWPLFPFSVVRLLRMAAREIRASPPASQDSSGSGRIKLLNSEDPSACLKFCANTSHLATFPDFPRPPPAGLSNCPPGRGARLWVSRQPKENTVGHPPATVTLVNRRGKAYARALRRIGQCLFPLFFSPAMSAGIFELWGISRSFVVAAN